MRKVLALVVLLALVASSQPALALHASDVWPQFRANSQNTGTADGIAPRTGQVLWSYKLGSPTGSSPAVADGKVFIGDSAGYVWALDAETGQKLWNYKTFGAIESSPTYLDGRIYIGSDDDNLTALNASDGHLIWTFKTTGTVKSSASVAQIHDNKTGALKTVLVFGSYDNFLYGIDTDGKELWRFKAASFIHGKPGIYNGMAFTCTCDRTMYGIDIETGHRAMNVTFGDYSAASPTALNGIVYGTARGGKVFAVNIQNQSLKWQVDLQKTIESSPAVGNGLVILGDKGSEVVALNNGTGSKVWSYTANGAVDSSPALVDGMVFIGDGTGYLLALNASTGSKVWDYHSDGAIDSSPAVAYGKVYFGTEGGTVYAMGSKDPQVRILAPQPWVKVKDKFLVQVEVFGTEITTVEVGNDGGNWTKAARNGNAGSSIWELTFDPKDLPNGEHKLYVRATNATGTGTASTYIVVKKPGHPKPFIPGLDLPTALGATIFAAVVVQLFRSNAFKRGRR